MTLLCSLPLVMLFHELWTRRLNGMHTCVVGVTCDRQWNPLDPHDPVQTAAEGLLGAGALPRLLYPEGDEPEVQLEAVQGLLLPGGADMDPVLYHEAPAGTRMEQVDREYDEFELACVRLGLERGLPVLGICRGAQMLAVACGGRLCQNLSDAGEHEQQPGTLEHPSHPVDLAPDSILGRELRTQLAVNSRHHQAVCELPPGLRVTARAPDGVVEGFEATEPPWRVGCEFHPESQRHSNGALNGLFARLAAEAAQVRG